MAKDAMIKLPSSVNELVIPAALTNKGKYPQVGRSAMLLYSLLSALPKEKDENGKEYLEISSADICDMLGCKESSFRMNLKALKQSNLIESYKPRFASVLRYIVKEVA